MAVLSIGQVWGATADVTYDFTGSDWSVSDGTLTDGSVSFTGEGSANFKMNTGYFILGKTNAYITFPTYAKAVEKIVVTGRSGASSSVGQNIYVGSTAVSTATTGATGSNTYNIASGYQAAGTVYTLKVTTNHNTQITKIEIFYKAETPASTCATPTFSPEAGEVVSGTQVSISCATADATIHYTTDGTTPTTSSPTYSSAITVSSAMTIKALAEKSGLSNSSVATAAYTVVTPLNTMDAIFEAATTAGSTATDVYIDFQDWVVSGAKGNTAYVTDGTKGFIVYYSGHGFAEGDILSGVGSFKIKLYNGAAELTAKNSGTITITKGGTAQLNELDAEGIAALSGVNTGSLIKVSGACTSESSKYYVAGVQLYTTLYSYTNPTAGKNYNCTGVYVQYNTTKEMMPRKAADIEEAVTKYTVTYEASPENGSLAIYDGSDLIASGSKVNEGTTLTIVTTPDAGFTLDGVTVNGSAYTESTLTLSADVTIAASFKANTAPEITSYVLSENGAITDKKAGQRVGDKDNLPLTAASCSKTFVGWSENASCAVAPEFAPGAEITLAANNTFYAVYADAHVVTPTDHALGSLTVGGTSGNTASEGYTYTSNKTNDKAGYTQDSGTKDADIVHLQIKAASQIINEEPSAIIVTAHLGAGADRETLTYPVNAVLVDADGNNVGAPVVLTNSIPDKNGDDFSANLPTANYADVRGVKISHMKEDGWNVRYYSMSFKYQTGGTTYSNYSTDCQAAVATPTFSPAAGTYTAVQNVTISSETTGATIYYTTNGEEPTASSTLYEGAITVDADMTIKAIAVKSGMANSAVATAAYTINLPLNTMDQIFAAATAAGSTATDANIQFNNWVVSGVSTNGKNVFVTDGTKGFIIFDNGGNMGFAVGDVLSGTVACKVQLFKGAAELTALSSTTEGLNIAKEGVVTPVAKAITALSGVNTGAPVIINSVQFDGTNLSDGANNIKPYNSLFAYDELEDGKYYNVTGIYVQYDPDKEILPRSAADIDEVDLSDPKISYTPASATIELGEDLPGTVFANPHELAISYSSNNEAVATVSNTGVIALGTATGTAVITASFAGDATYAAGNATYTITVNPASVSENVVILAQYDTKYYAMPTAVNTSGACEAIAVEYDGSQVTVASAEDKAAIQWTRKTSGDNTTFQNASSKYLKGTSGGASLSLADDACNWSWDATNGYYYIPGSTVRSFFYKNDGVFKNYAVSNLTNAAYAGVQVIVIDPANIVITSKVSAELAYNPASDEITEGDAWSAPTLVNPHTVAITSYNSDNEGVATVTDGGVIALAGGIGTAHITAHFDGDASYLEGDAVYTITVNAPAPTPTGTTYTKVTSTGDITDGEYLIVYETTSVAFNGALETLDAEGNSVAVVINEGVIAGTTAIDAAVFTIDVTAGTLQSASGKYIGVSSNSNGLKQTEDASTYTHTFSIDGDGNAVIFANFESSTMKLRYNPSTSAGNLRFRYYKNDGQQAIQLYKKETITPPTPSYTEVRNGLTEGWYYTMCLDKAVTAVQGASIWRVLSKAANGTDVIMEEVIGTLDAGRPYIFRAAANTLEVAYTGDAVGAPVTEGNNGLVGSFSQVKIANVNTNYIIYNNELYYVNTDNVYVGEHRAYLDMTGVPAYSGAASAPGRRRVTMAVHGEQVATGMDALDASEAPVKMIINGQLFILRGEKMYNVNGQLVK